MTKAITVNELITRLQNAVQMVPECGEYTVQYHDWNEQYWDVEQGILNIRSIDKIIELG